MNYVIRKYRDRFRLYETLGLDVENTDHIFALHHMFLPLINADLSRFVEIWNNHRVRTEHNYTPLMIRYSNAEIFPVPLQVEDDYGLDMDVIEEINPQAVVVDELQCNLDEEEQEEVRIRCPSIVLHDNSDEFDNRMRNCLDIVHEIRQRKLIFFINLYKKIN